MMVLTAGRFVKIWYYNLKIILVCVRAFLLKFDKDFIYANMHVKFVNHTQFCVYKFICNVEYMYLASAAQSATGVSEQKMS